MSVIDFLNPDPSSVLNPDYGYQVSDLQRESVFQPRTGPPISRATQSGGRVFDLLWNNRGADEKWELERFERQYRNGLFVYRDCEGNGRYYNGRFAGPLQCSPQSNDRWNIRGRFVEILGVGQVQFPPGAPADLTIFNRDGIFIYSADDFGNLNPQFIGTWTKNAVHAQAKFIYSSYSNEANAKARIRFTGLAARYWTQLVPTGGIAQIYIDDVLQAEPSCYAGVATASAPTGLGFYVGPGEHILEVRCKGVAGPGGGKFVFFDAIQVLM